MTDAEYLSLQCRLVLLAQLIKPLDLFGFLLRMEAAHAIGPILEPTLYIKAKKHLDSIERIAKAAKAFQDEIRKIAESPQEGNPLAHLLNGDEC